MTIHETKKETEITPNDWFTVAGVISLFSFIITVVSRLIEKLDLTSTQETVLTFLAFIAMYCILRTASRKN